MKTLAHKIIIYDDVCPLCKAYTNGFVNLGWLLPNHRIGFSAAPKELLEHIDLERARHEIPLYDTETKQTLYGKEALFYILGEEFPVFKPLFRFAPFRFLIHGFYQIITYNRRIIAGSKAPTDGFDCAPDFNGFYRWLYISLAFISGILLLFKCHIFYEWPMISLYLLTIFAILKGLSFKGFIYKTDYFGHLTTVFLLTNILAAIVGYANYALVILVPLGAYCMGRRLSNK
ncbi:MAG: DUF393 domain-containing protein [Bacteroidetes bacterium]|nr:DUF393 domain-containing protein [Bacteroidota bacterium]